MSRTERDWPRRSVSESDDVDANGHRGGPHGLSRRDFVAASLGAFAVAALAPTALGRRRRRLVRRSIPVMGTVAEIAVVADGDRDRSRAAIDAAFAELRRVDRTMTRYSDRSDVGRANLHASSRPVSVEPATAHVIRRALAWARASDGVFDPCLAGAVALWDVKHRSEPPPPERVRHWADRGLYRDLELDRSGDRALVRYANPDVGLDLGGIAKGYGVDRAVRALRDHGVRDALVNAGGDLYALGRSPDGDAWKIGVRSPADPSRIVSTVRLRNRGVATSGDYEQYFAHGGRRYHHLLDPRTGTPRRTRIHSTTVSAESCLDADAAATAAFGADPADARRLLATVDPGADLIRPGNHPKEVPS